MGVADDFAAGAAIQPSFSNISDPVQERPDSTQARSFADRAEGAIQRLSRWAGILAFCAAVAGIAYLIF